MFCFAQGDSEVKDDHDRKGTVVLSEAKHPYILRFAQQESEAII